MSSLNRSHNPGHQRRQPLRLSGYDYAQPGCYFVTVVTQERRCLFGDIAEAEMRLNDAGEMAQKAWAELPQRFPTITLDAFVIMPNIFTALSLSIRRMRTGQPQGLPLPRGMTAMAGQGLPLHWAMLSGPINL